MQNITRKQTLNHTIDKINTPQKFEKNKTRRLNI